MSPDKLVEYAIILAGAIGTWAVMRYKLDSHSRQIDKLWDWKDNHEKEANAERLLLHNNVAKLEGNLEFRGRENIEIMKRIEKIDSNVELMKDDLSYLKAKNKGD